MEELFDLGTDAGVELDPGLGVELSDEPVHAGDLVGPRPVADGPLLAFEVGEPTIDEGHRDGVVDVLRELVR